MLKKTRAIFALGVFMSALGITSLAEAQPYYWHHRHYHHRHWDHHHWRYY